MRPERFDRITKILTHRSTRRKGVALLAVGSLSGLVHRHATTAAQEQVREIEILSADKDHIEGILKNEGQGLGFSVGPSNGLQAVRISALSGQEVLAIEPDGDRIVTRIAGGRLKTSIARAEAQAILAKTAAGTPVAESAGGTETSEQSLTQVASNPGTSGTTTPGPVKRPRRPSNDAVKVFTELSQTVAVEGDTAAIDDLRSSAAYALLPELSYALSTVALTGQSYPPSLALHVLGLTAATDLGLDPRTSWVVYRYKLPHLVPRVYTAQQFLDYFNSDYLECIPPGVDPDLTDANICGGGGSDVCEAYPNRDQDCFGMCGPDCTHPCWDGICGDCCYHEFCADHDDLFRACADSANPAACFWSTAGAPLVFAVEGGCDGWSWLWPF